MPGFADGYAGRRMRRRQEWPHTGVAGTWDPLGPLSTAQHGTAAAEVSPVRCRPKGTPLMSTTVAGASPRYPAAAAAAAHFRGEQSSGCSNSLDVALAADPAHVATARRAVTAHLRHWKLEHLAADAELITSELVTNAVLYGVTETVTVHLAEYGTAPDRHLLITVADRSPAAAVPPARTPADAEECGRGLHILQCLAGSWGTMAKPGGGKLVWATLAE